MIAYNQPQMAAMVSGSAKYTWIIATRLRLLFFLIFSTPFGRWELFGSSLLVLPNILFLIYLPMCVFSIREIYNFNKVKYGFIPFLLLVALLWTMSAINYFPSSEMAYSEVRRVTLVLLFFVAIANEIRLRPWLENQLLFAYLIGLYVAVIFYAVGIGVRGGGGRLSILGLNSNAMALLFLLGLFSSIKILLEMKLTSFVRMLVLFFAILFLVVIVASGSRSAIVGLAIGPTVYLFFFKLPFKKKLPFLVYGGFALLIMLLVVLNTNMVQQRIQEQTEDQNWGGRLPIWETTILLVYERPWFGAGASGYESHFLKYHSGYHAVHNVYLQILAYSGIVGLSIFLWLLLRLGKSANQINKVNGSPFYLAVWFTYLIYYFTGGGVFASFVLWFFMGLTLGLAINIKLSNSK